MYLTRLICLMFLIGGLATACISGDDDDPSNAERERAIEAALEVYAEVAAGGADLSNGPCIAEELETVPGWSVDIAHDPREAVDDDPANQCQAYRDGRTQHFVELTPEGTLIRAR